MALSVLNAALVAGVEGVAVLLFLDWAPERWAPRVRLALPYLAVGLVGIQLVLTVGVALAGG